jgi:hypothetical protein
MGGFQDLFFINVMQISNVCENSKYILIHLKMERRRVVVRLVVDNGDSLVR